MTTALRRIQNREKESDNGINQKIMQTCTKTSKNQLRKPDYYVYKSKRQTKEFTCPKRQNEKQEKKIIQTKKRKTCFHIICNNLEGDLKKEKEDCFIIIKN